MKTDTNAYMVTYVSVMGLAVALLLTGVGRFTAPRKAANEQAEKIRNILQVFNVPIAPDAGPGEVKAAYDQNIREDRRGQTVRYLYVPAGASAPQAVAVGFEGPGLWGPIKGLLALEPDMTTVRGITFYQQEETPGLGGEIATEGFRARFAGKTILAPDGKRRLTMCNPGMASAAHEVDAITGATMTCRKVESMINGMLAGLEEGATP